MLFLAFRGDVLDVMELVTSPRPIPAFAGTPLHFYSRGKAEVTTTLKWDDPQYRHQASKVFTLPLAAGNTYTITMTAEVATPVLVIENEYGDYRGHHANGEPQPPKLVNGFPVYSNVAEAKLDFVPEVDAEYRNVCQWFLSSERGGAFTLNVQMK